MTFMVYTTTIIWSMILSYLAQLNEKRNKKYKHFIVSVILLFSVVCGLRGVSVGTDTPTYYRWFVDYKNYKYKRSGILFNLIVHIVMNVTGSPQVVFLVIAILANIFFVCAFWNYREIVRFDYAILFYGLLLYFNNYNVMRQCVAIAIVFFSTKYLFQNETYKYFVFVIVATLFHYSAIVSIILVFILDICKKKYLRVKIGLSMFLIYFLLFILGIILFPTIIQRVIVQYGHYLNGQYWDNSSGYMVMARMILLLMISIATLFYNDIIVDGKDIIYLKIFLISDFIYQLSCALAYRLTIAHRVGWYFLPFEILLYSKICEKRKKSIVIYMCFLVSVFLSGYVYLAMFMTENHDLVPYVLGKKY